MDSSQQEEGAASLPSKDSNSTHIQSSHLGRLPDVVQLHFSGLKSKDQEIIGDTGVRNRSEH